MDAERLAQQHMTLTLDHLEKSFSRDEAGKDAAAYVLISNAFDAVGKARGYQHATNVLTVLLKHVKDNG
jgi:hypothetical protein